MAQVHLGCVDGDRWCQVLYRLTAFVLDENGGVQVWCRINMTPVSQSCHGWPLLLRGSLCHTLFWRSDAMLVSMMVHVSSSGWIFLLVRHVSSLREQGREAASSERCLDEPLKRRNRKSV